MNLRSSSTLPEGCGPPASWPSEPGASVPPGAAFEARGRLAAADGSREAGGGEDKGPAESRVALWDSRFLLCLFFKIDTHFYFEMHVFPWLKKRNYSGFKEHQQSQPVYAKLPVMSSCHRSHKCQVLEIGHTPIPFRLRLFQEWREAGEVPETFQMNPDALSLVSHFFSHLEKITS